MDRNFLIRFHKIFGFIVDFKPLPARPCYLAMEMNGVVIPKPHRSLMSYFSPFLKSRTTRFSSEKIIHEEIVSSFNFLQNKDTIGWRPFRILLDKILTLKISPWFLVQFLFAESLFAESTFFLVQFLFAEQLSCLVQFSFLLFGPILVCWITLLFFNWDYWLKVVLVTYLSSTSWLRPTYHL